MRFLLFLCIFYNCFAQKQTNFLSVDSLEALHRTNNTKLNLEIINNELVKDIPDFQRQILNAYKLKPLVDGGLYAEALKVSEILLQENRLNNNLKIKAYLGRALLYEINDEFDNSLIQFDSLKYLFDKYPKEKDEDYGAYLYRKASLYRVNKLNDSAKYYSQKAIDFSTKKGFKTSASVGHTLMGMLRANEDYDLSKYHYEKAIQLNKDINDASGTAMAYLNLAKLLIDNEKYEEALRYTDSTMALRDKVNTDFFIHAIYSQKATIYEITNRPDLALQNQKASQQYLLQHRNNLQTIELSELKFNYEIEKEALEKDQLIKDNIAINTYNTRLLILVLCLFAGLAILLIFYKKLQNNSKALEKGKQEKELLLKELHHRVKNNLMLILSLIDFQKDEFENPLFKMKFKDLQHRIEAITFVHEQMATDIDSELGDTYNVKSYILKITQTLIGLHPESVDLSEEIEDYNLSLQEIVPIGMIVNELVSNSLKYAQVDKNKTLGIVIKLVTIEDKIILYYNDNGKILKSAKIKEGLGLFIVKNMVRQLKGQLQNNNFEFTISINKPTSNL